MNNTPLNTLTLALENPEEAPDDWAETAETAIETAPEATAEVLLKFATGPEGMAQLMASKIISRADEPAFQRVVARHVKEHGESLSDVVLADLIESLAVTASEPATRDHLLALAADSERIESLRTGALDALAGGGDESAAEGVAALLDDEEEDIRIHAALALRQLGGDIARDALIRVARPDEPSIGVREAATLGLLVLGVSPRGGWEPFLEDDEEGIREIARDAIEEQG